jgi:hypothetical protein
MPRNIAIGGAAMLLIASTALASELASEICTGR